MNSLGNKFFYLISVLGLTALLFGPFVGRAEVFTHNLILGSQRPEVKILQIFLNFDSATRVSQVGAGSLGQETDYFGAKTKQALIKFQTKYGLQLELGCLGSQTRTFLNQKIVDLLASSREKVAVSNDKTVKTLVQPAVVEAPVLLSLSPTNGNNGVFITLTGRNFLPQDNTVISGYGDLENVVSVDGQMIQFPLNFPANEIFRDEETGEVSLPGNLHLPIWFMVANKNGTSSSLIYDLQI